MEEEYKHGRTEQDMKENGKTTRPTERGNFNM